MTSAQHRKRRAKVKSMQIIGANAKIPSTDGNDVYAIIDGEGNKTTCWTPSPEELENLIAGGYVRFVTGIGEISAECIHPFPPDE